MSVPEQPEGPQQPGMPGGSPEFNSPDVNSPVPAPSHNGGRNPLALVVVAVVAAAALACGMWVQR